MLCLDHFGVAASAQASAARGEEALGARASIVSIISIVAMVFCADAGGGKN